MKYLCYPIPIYTFTGRSGSVMQLLGRSSASWASFKHLGEENPTGQIFHDRHSIPDRARVCVRKACSDLNILSLGTHGFRKTFAEADYQRNIQAGASDQQALLKTAQQLGHNRADVTRQSYISPSQRKRSGRRKSG